MNMHAFFLNSLNSLSQDIDASLDVAEEEKNNAFLGCAWKP